jgi:hypothetical protein
MVVDRYLLFHLQYWLRKQFYLVTKVWLPKILFIYLRIIKIKVMTQGDFMLVKDVMKYIPTLDPNLLIKFNIGDSSYYKAKHVAETMTSQEFRTMECHVATLMLIDKSK